MASDAEKTAIVISDGTYTLMCGACCLQLANRGVVGVALAHPYVRHFNERYIVAAVLPGYSLETIEDLRDHSLHS